MVEIVLASYNGEKYISEQVNSILNQTYSDWKLIIRDDNSNDNTIEILNKYEQKFPNKIRVIRAKENLGAKGNFIRLLQECSADYIFFCDQDDIWFPEKLEIVLGLMKETEQKEGKSTPILVHSDLTLINENNQVLANSFWKYSKLNGDEKRLSRLIMQNSVTGCAMCINKKLLNMCIFTNMDIAMHDWWITLIASKFGIIRALPLPTIYYRQHSANEVGAKNYRSITYKIKKIKSGELNKRSIQLTIEQAQLFLITFENQLAKEDIQMLVDYTAIKNKSKLVRLYILFKYNIFKKGILRNLGLLLYI